MPLDREGTLKKAEKLLRQGRVDAAIAEYVRVVEEQPRDWTTANALGDLYARAGQADKAIAQYSRIAEHFMREGFYPKAAALYKKILKITPDDETSQIKLAELSTKQGLLADAKSYWNAIATRRQARGDRVGAAAVIIRLGEIDPTDFDARFAAARTLVEIGDSKKAAAHFRQLHADLLEKGRDGEATAALRQAVTLNPSDKEGRATLARAFIDAADYDNARKFLDRESAGDDPPLLIALIHIDLRLGQLDEARELAKRLLHIAPSSRESLVQLASTLGDKKPDVAFVCIETAVEAASKAADHASASRILQDFIARTPGHIAALLKLVEVCVDGGLETPMYAAQAKLADAYLAAGQAADARLIAEDLVAREPWEREHIERFRQALMLLRVSDPDTVIAERLSGQAPFTAHDPFADAESEPSRTAELSSDAADASLVASVAGKGERPSAFSSVDLSADDASLSDHVEIDLTSILGDLHSTELEANATDSSGAPKDDLEHVFRTLREDAARHAGPEESDEKLTLARTYLDMGMEEEAIAALQAAGQSPVQRFEAASTLGRLYRQRGDAARAIEWLERASQASAPSQDEEYVLLYELGSLLEKSGQTARALAVFLELQAGAGEYRDVSQRIDHLARVQTGG